METTHRRLALRSLLAGTITLAPVCTHAVSGDQTPLAAPAPPRTFQTEKEVWATPFKSQARSLTCWCFSTTSFLESEARRLGRGDFELSPMFTVYHEFLEKAQRHVRTHGSNRFNPGGLPHDVLHAVRRWGAVPRASYTGLLPPETQHDQFEMYAALDGLMSGVLKSGLENPVSGRWVNGAFEAKWLDALRGTQDAYMGKPPTTVQHDGRTLTPRQFADEVLRLPLDDYVEITSYSHLPFYGRGELLVPDNWMHQSLYNVPLDDFVRLIDHALNGGFSVVFDVHISDAEFKDPANYVLGHDEEKGVHTTQDLRDTQFESWRSEDVHVEHAIGLAKDETGKRFYRAKDSNTPSGQRLSPWYNKEYFSVEFVRSRVLLVMVHKDGLPADIRSRLAVDRN